MWKLSRRWRTKNRNAFPADVFVKCDLCKGERFNRETLEIKFKNKSISDVLNMTVEEGLSFFKAIPSISSKLET